jgi:hypothetical protein
MNWLIYFIVLTGEAVAGGKPLERSDWPRQTGMVHVFMKSRSP